MATWAGYKKAGPLLTSTEHRVTADGGPARIFSDVSVKPAGSDTWAKAQECVQTSPSRRLPKSPPSPPIQITPPVLRPHPNLPTICPFGAPKPHNRVIAATSSGASMSPRGSSRAASLALQRRLQFLVSPRNARPFGPTQKRKLAARIGPRMWTLNPRPPPSAE